MCSGFAGNEGSAAREAAFRIEPRAPASHARHRGRPRRTRSRGAAPARPSGRVASARLPCTRIAASSALLVLLAAAHTQPSDVRHLRALPGLREWRWHGTGALCRARAHESERADEPGRKCEQPATPCPPVSHARAREPRPRCSPPAFAGPAQGRWLRERRSLSQLRGRTRRTCGRGQSRRATRLPCTWRGGLRRRGSCSSPPAFASRRLGASAVPASARLERGASAEPARYATATLRCHRWQRRP